MGLSWQQGPLAPGAVGRFLVPEPLPDRMLFAEPLRRRMRVRFGGDWIADSEDVVLLHEPGRYPVAYFPLAAVADGVAPARRAHHRGTADLGPTTWYTVQAGEHSKPRAAWQHTGLPGLRQRAEGPGRVRVAGDGGLLRGRRADRRPCRRPLPPHRYPADQPPPDRSVPETRSSPTPGGRWRCTSPGSRPAGTSPATTSTRPPSPRPRARPSARTRAWPATTTSAARAARRGPTRTPGPRSGASPA